MGRYVIEVSGGHLSSKRYVHQTGLLTGEKAAAERFELSKAIELIRLNLPETSCKLKAAYVSF
jgi:hypothetical protein